MNPKELIDLLAGIVEQRGETLYRFIENADKCDHRDRGIEGWFQTVLSHNRVIHLRR